MDSCHLCNIDGRIFTLGTLLDLTHKLEKFLKKKLSGKAAIVTGSGIGRAIAKLFALEGAIAIVADISVDSAAETVNQIEADGNKGKAFTVDVTNQEQVDKMITSVKKQFGRIDILVNNAATSRGNDILTIDEEM